MHANFRCETAGVAAPRSSTEATPRRGALQGTRRKTQVYRNFPVAALECCARRLARCPTSSR
jgi:hypothetical protein